jgi:hypothetical protein
MYSKISLFKVVHTVKTFALTGGSFTSYLYSQEKHRIYKLRRSNEKWDRILLLAFFSCYY